MLWPDIKAPPRKNHYQEGGFFLEIEVRKRLESRTHLVPGWLSIGLLILTHLVPVSQQALGLLCWIEAHQACM